MTFPATFSSGRRRYPSDNRSRAGAPRTDAVRARDRAHYLAHHEERKAYSRAYRQAHREERMAYDRARYAAHREEVNAAGREARRVAREERRRKQVPLRDRRRASYRVHRAARIASALAYQRDHKVYAGGARMAIPTLPPEWQPIAYALRDLRRATKRED